MATGDEFPPRDIVTSKAFERDLKRLRKRGIDLEPLWAVVENLRLGRPLEARLRDHALTGDCKGFRDCHVQSDWVLIYSLDEEAVYLALRAPTPTSLVRGLTVSANLSAFPRLNPSRIQRFRQRTDSSAEKFLRLARLRMVHPVGSISGGQPANRPF